MFKRIRPITALLKQCVKFLFFDVRGSHRTSLFRRTQRFIAPGLLRLNCGEGASRRFQVYCNARIDAFGTTLEQDGSPQHEIVRIS